MNSLTMTVAMALLVCGELACGSQAPQSAEPVLSSEADDPTEGEAAAKLLKLLMGDEGTPLSAVDSDLSAFRKAAAEMGLTYAQPKGFSRTPFVKNEDFSYDYAVVSDDKKIEIRMALRPVGPFLPAGVPPHFARVFFDTGVSNLTNGDRTGDTYESDEMVSKEDFGANAVGAVIIDWHDEEFEARHFGKGYGIVLIVYMHRNEIGSAYAFFLGRDKETLENRLSEELLKTLKFTAND
ncbi:MAG: hypothetical protein GY811_19240 [Myxococcales bacterium]|nr:hypothetical protein [Myxococcales bacterium]